MTSERLPIAGSRDTWRHTIALLRRRPVLLTVTLVAMLAGTAAGLLIPALLGRVVDAVREGRDGDLVPLIVLMAGSIATSALLAWIGEVQLARVAQSAIAELRERVLGRALVQPAAVLERAGTGDLVSRVSGDVNAVTVAISQVLPTFVGALFTIALTVGGLALLDGRLALAALLAVPLQLFALRRFLRSSRPLYQELRIAQAERGQQLIESFAGADTVRTLRLQNRHEEAIAARSERAIGIDIDTVRVRTVFFSRLNGAEYIGLAAILVVGYLLVGHDGLTIGAATAAALYFYNLFGPIGSVLALVDELQNAGTGLARLFGVAGMPASPDDSRLQPLSEGAAGVTADAITAGHEVGVPALDAVSVRLGPGERIAVVGSSGAGKTTLAKVVTGQIAPWSGTVIVHGPAGAVSGGIALVSQEVHLFSGTVADNLRLVRPTASDEELRTVLTRVHAHWVAELDDGLDTRIGSDGRRLTAAQGQQLALARMVLADPAVVVLDEATAEAGTDAAGLLDRAAEQALAGRTALVIAHRLSQAVSADRVIVMAEGRIVEEGTHTELVAAEGRYAQLWRAWKRGGGAS